MSTTTKTAEDYKDDPRVVAQADIETHEEIPCRVTANMIAATDLAALLAENAKLRAELAALRRSAC